MSVDWRHASWREQPVSTTAPTPGSNGTGAWALGFLAYVPFPIVAQIMTGLIMAGVYPIHKKRGPIAHANARNAANWGLTYSILTVVFFGIALVFAAIVTNGGTMTVPFEASIPAIIPLALWLLMTVVHVIVVIVGTVKASRGTVFRVPFAIRFIAE